MSTMLGLKRRGDDGEQSVNDVQPAGGAAFSPSDLIRTDTSFSMAGAAARIAGRLAAASTSEEELSKLFAERQKLLQKKMVSSLSSAETRRLRYVRWQIERVEDAKIGPHLDKLEAAIEQYESFAIQINDLFVALSRHGARGRRARK